MLHHKSNRELLKEFNHKVEGHIEAKKALINLVNRSKIRHKQQYIDGLPKDKLITSSNCLLIGSSGTGKSFMVDTLREMIEFPLVKVDATKLNPSGAGEGGIKSSDLMKLIINNAKQLCAEKKHLYYSVLGTIAQTVVFVDEIDKISTKWESSGKWNSHVQANFLTLFENSDEFAGVSFIFAGAFTGIDEVELDSARSSSIGFNAEISKGNRVVGGLDEKVIKMGLIPELVGRISSIVQLDKFTKEDYRNILLNRLIPKKEEDLLYFNYGSVDLTESQIEDMLDKAMNSGQGVRFLKRELDAYLRDVEFSYEEYPLEYNNMPQGWEDLIVDKIDFTGE